MSSLLQSGQGLTGQQRAMGSKTDSADDDSADWYAYVWFEGKGVEVRHVKNCLSPNTARSDASVIDVTPGLTIISPLD